VNVSKTEAKEPAPAELGLSPGSGPGSDPGLGSDASRGVDTAASGQTRHRFLVVADDLTGAADAAVALAGTGHPAWLFLRPGPLHCADSAIAALDLDTRGMPEAQAAQAVEDLAAGLDSGDRQLFKKIDSTLRGHIGAELDALHHGLARQRRSAHAAPLFIVAPAHPALGRSLIDGALHLTQTHTASNEPVQAPAPGENDATLQAHGNPPRPHDAASPPSDDATLRHQLESFGFACTHITVEELRDPRHARQLADRIQQAALGAKAAIICDAQTPQDLRRTVAAVGFAAVRCVWVGSAGLAGALGEPLPARSAAAACPPAPAPRKLANRSTLFLVGSHSATARQQIRELLQAGSMQYVALGIDSADASAACERAGRTVDAALAARQDLLVCIDPQQRIMPERSAALAAQTAALLAPRLDQLGALVCCGGATARAVFDAAGLTHCQAQHTPEPGVAHLRFESMPGLPILTKAGAFGDARSLVRLRQYLEPT
jgi:uncharacterized protein YgbK (DUF1537 family)